MKCLTDKRVIVPILLFVLTILVSCIPAVTGEPNQQPPIPSPTASELGQPTRTITPTASVTQALAPSATLCPIPTQELFWVDPVTSPTDRLSQVITVHIGNGEEVTVITESGTFSMTGNASAYSIPASVEISLLPNAVHHLEVVAKVRTILAGGCMYGGYTLRTTRDSQGTPLTIVQGEPIPRQAVSIVTVDNALHLEELTSFAPVSRLVTDFVFSSDNEVISVGYDSNISVWSTNTGKEIRQIGNTRTGALVVAINSDHSLIATGGTADDPSIRLWNTQTGEMNELDRHQSYLTSIEFNPNGTRLAGGSNDDYVMIWDIDRRQLLISLKGDVPSRLQSFSNLYWIDNDMLVAGGSDAIYWWDTNTGKLLKRLAKPNEADFFVDVAFSQGGDQVAAAAQDAYVYFWDRRIETWSRWPALSDSRITNVSFSPGGKLLVAGTDQGQLLIWNVETQQLLAHYSIISRSIAAIRFSSDGRYIAVGGWDGPIRVWGIP